MSAWAGANPAVIPRFSKTMRCYKGIVAGILASGAGVHRDMAGLVAGILA